MKLIVPTLALCLLGFGYVSSGSQSTAKDLTVIISGGARGHLSPCGCTKPMSGGFKRLATIVKELKAKGDVVWIDTGDIIDTPGRQSQLKAETYGELLGSLGVDAVAYTNRDQRQGIGLLVAAASLSKTKWITPGAEPGTPTISVATVKGLTISATNQQVLGLQGDGACDVLLIDGPKSALSGVKGDHELQVFASEGIPTIEGAKVSPGSNLRGVVVARFRENRLVSAKVELLESSIKEDPKAEEIYYSYLSRVAQERLIDGVPKETAEDFAGSKNCVSCHTTISHQFDKTKHATAYRSLVKEGHQADPDCVSCHVVGLNSTKGFYYEKTPSLAQVGCESCHGPGRAHAQKPKQIHLPKVTEQKCLSCHTPSNSPSFVFKTFWKKIKH